MKEIKIIGDDDYEYNIAKRITMKYLIWSNEHQGWWRPLRAGYTDHIELAGQYDQDEALKIVEEANKFIKWEHFPNEPTPVPFECLVPVIE